MATLGLRKGVSSESVLFAAIEVLRSQLSNLAGVAAMEYKAVVALGCLVASSILVSGCATSSRAKKENTASTIDYILPVTQVTVGLNLVITKCEAPATLKGSITLTPSAVPSPYAGHHLRISGPELASFWKKQDITIELHPNSAIKSVNGATSDRTSAILVNSLKIATSFSGLAVTERGGLRCNKETLDAFNEAKKLRESRIKPLRAALVNGTAKNVVETQKQIDVFAQQAASIQSERLSMKLESKLTFLDETRSGTIRWKKADLEQHFSSTLDDIEDFALTWKIDLAKDPPCFNNCEINLANAAVDCMECPRTLVFREPRIATLTVKMIEQDKVSPAELIFPMAQWGKITYLPLKAYFGESRSLRLALDEYGRRSAFTWASAARGEEVTSSASGILDAASAHRAAQESADTKAQKAEIDELETRKKWNALKRCEAVIEAGGSECPN